MNCDDTIAAISTAEGLGPRTILRMSGDAALAIARQIGFRDDQAETTLRIGSLNVVAMVWVFRAPRSVTGQDVVELHVPGSPLLARRALEAVLASGARQAEPGEFTARAYLNGKIDLTAAEGVAATIAAANRQQLDAARRLLAGELAARLRPIMDSLAETLALVEVGIDFTDQDVTFISDAELRSRIDAIDRQLGDVLDNSARFERWSAKPRVVLAGRPNAGKSTLLNRLAGRRRAVVSPVAGTTRDALSACICLPRGEVTIVDVAGIERPGDDDIHRQMQATTQSELSRADVVVLLTDATDPAPPLKLPVTESLRVWTKCDLTRREGLCVSATTGEGLDELVRRLDALCFAGDAESAGVLALNARHVGHVSEARDAVGRAGAIAQSSPELVAADLRDALDELGRVLGAISAEDVLGRIFGQFCIGK